MIIKDSDYICPACESENTIQTRPFFIAASGFLFLGIGAWTFSIPVLGLGFIIFGTGMIIISPFLGNIHICKTCRKIWKIKDVKKVSTDKIIDFMERSQKYKSKKK